MKIEKSHDHFRMLFDFSSDGLLIVDMQGNFIDINRTAHERLGYSKAEMLAMKLTDLDPPEFAARVPERMEQIKKHGMVVFETAHCRKDGSIMPVEVNARVIDLDGERVVFSTVRDITERRQAEEKIRQMAYHDHLTGLPNRALFYDRLQQALAHAHRNRKRLALLILDLDHFKPINDELGHEYGDRALVETGKRLRQCVRETDSVARIGGDEFAIILVDIASEKAACRMAEKVIAAIGQPLSLNTSQYVLGASIGICLTAPDDDDMEAMVSRADTAMYRAKESGRNRYCVAMQESSPQI
ncbi:MAG: diguanylate cyclase [Mariprofundaceae bacterium]|nr:diguanylate cyclase [Mariprofundaceae bacterium]